jgi:hypothetical protein
MPRLTILLLSLVLGAGSAVLISCGGDDGPDGPAIPTDDSDGMLNELNIARSAFEAGDCAKVEESANEIQASAENLAEAERVDPEIADGISEGAAHLAELAQTSSECEEATTTTNEDDDEDKTTTTPEPTTTTPTTTPTTTTTTTEEAPPPDDDGGDDVSPPVEPPGQAPGGPPSPGGGGTGGVGDGE